MEILQTIDTNTERRRRTKEFLKINYRLLNNFNVSEDENILNYKKWDFLFNFKSCFSCFHAYDKNVQTK